MDNDNYLHRYINAEWIDILFTNDYTPFKLHPYFCFTKLPITPPPFIHFHFNKYFWILIIINCVLTWSIKCTCDPYQILMRQLWIGSYLAVLLYISPSSIKKRKENESCFRCIFNIIYFLLQCLYIDIACVFWIPY